MGVFNLPILHFPFLYWYPCTQLQIPLLHLSNL